MFTDERYPKRFSFHSRVSSFLFVFRHLDFVILYDYDYEHEHE